MIIKELIFKYNLNFINIYNLAVENNSEFIKIIPEIVFYEKGSWSNNKRTDFIKINILDVPSDLKNIIDLMKDDNNLIGIKIKIKKKIFDDKIIIKTKLKLKGIIGSLINNAVNLRAIFVISKEDELKTCINVNYQINSFLFNDLNDKFNNHIQSKLENYYIKNIDLYFKNLNV